MNLSEVETKIIVKCEVHSGYTPMLDIKEINKNTYTETLIKNDGSNDKLYLVFKIDNDGILKVVKPYDVEYQRAISDIKDKDTMNLVEANYNSWFNFLTDSYEGNNIEIYYEVLNDLGEEKIEKMWIESHIK